MPLTHILTHIVIVSASPADFVPTFGHHQRPFDIGGGCIQCLQKKHSAEYSGLSIYFCGTFPLRPEFDKHITEVASL